MNIIVTDHAVLRYVERVMGIDVEAIRAEMASHAVQTAAAMQCHTVKLGNGARLKLKGGTVMTVLGKGMRPAKGSW
jgi:hypothetical protein